MPNKLFKGLNQPTQPIQQRKESLWSRLNQSTQPIPPKEPGVLATGKKMVTIHAQTEMLNALSRLMQPPQRTEVEPEQTPKGPSRQAQIARVIGKGVQITGRRGLGLLVQTVTRRIEAKHVRKSQIKLIEGPFDGNAKK